MPVKSSSISNKTVRPGLGNYSFYSSARRPVAKQTPKKTFPIWPVVIVVAVVAGLAIGLKTINTHSSGTTQPVAKTSTTAKLTTPKTTAPQAAPAVTPPLNHCDGNSLSHLVKVSISQRHMWACEGAKSVYDSPVITGMEFLAADLTPRGTYHVYGKYTDQVLTGSDSTGSWRDPVDYWMPFLYNRYGAYGFHDATWRPDSSFGNVDPNTSDASHGCVELPLSTAKWLYGWAAIGTTVTIES